MRQVEAVAARVTELCAAHDVQPLHVNVLGLSRGGIAAYMLARHVSRLKCASRLRLNLCVFDPVPGNLVSTAKYLDLFGNVTTANRYIDLRGCRIVRCLALYPADPLPDLAFHAPLLPDYPKGCEVEEDATLGCHQACSLCTHARDPRHDTHGTVLGLGQAPSRHGLITHPTSYCMVHRMVFARLTLDGHHAYPYP